MTFLRCLFVCCTVATFCRILNTSQQFASPSYSQKNQATAKFVNKIIKRHCKFKVKLVVEFRVLIKSYTVNYYDVAVKSKILSAINHYLM